MMTSPSSSFSGRTALITGASAGLGVEFARQLAALGCHLILTARREDRLKSLAEELQEKAGIRVSVFSQDLSEPGGARALFARIQKEELSVDYLVNNAGFGLFGPFWDDDAERIEAMIRVNVESVTTLTSLCVAPMREQGFGGILNVASTAAFQPIPTFAVYAASKAYVLSLSEALAVELKDSGVVVHALCPGPTTTEFQSLSGTENMAPTWAYESAEQVARRGLEGLVSGKMVKVSGLGNWVMANLPRFFPRSWVARVTGWLFELSESRSRSSHMEEPP